MIAVRVVEPPALTGNDRAYVRTVQGSAVITLVSLALLLARLRFRAGEPTPRSPSVPASTGG